MLRPRACGNTSDSPHRPPPRACPGGAFCGLASLTALVHTATYLTHRITVALDAYRQAGTSDTGLRIHAGTARSDRCAGPLACETEAAAVAAHDPRPRSRTATLWRPACLSKPDATGGTRSILATGRPARRGESQPRSTSSRTRSRTYRRRRRRSAQYGTIFSTIRRVRHYDASAMALVKYLSLLPGPQRSDAAAWARAQARFLQSYGGLTPVDFVSREQVYTVPFRIEKDRIRANAWCHGNTDLEFFLDTGAEHSLITPGVVKLAGVTPVETLQTAGVGNAGVGFRTLQVARLNDLELGSLHVRNVTCLIKDPTLFDLPSPESEGFSPLDLGASIITTGRCSPSPPAADGQPPALPPSARPRPFAASAGRRASTIARHG